MADIFVAPKKEESRKKDYFPLEHKDPGIISSFHLYPSNVKFKEQEENEEVVLFLRRHFVTNISWLIITLVIIALPIIFFINRGFLPIPPLPNSFNIIAFIFYFTVVSSYIYINFIAWYFNVSLVTQKRLVDIHFVDIIYHDMAVTKLNLIEDVAYTQAGFLRSLFNYGDIFAQTAGEKMHFDFLAVPQPEHVLNIIENLMGGDRHVH
jgi:hypothetical protein